MQIISWPRVTSDARCTRVCWFRKPYDLLSDGVYTDRSLPVFRLARHSGALQITGCDTGYPVLLATGRCGLATCDRSGSSVGIDASHESTTWLRRACSAGTVRLLALAQALREGPVRPFQQLQ